MKTKHLILALCSIAVLHYTSILRAQTWETVDTTLYPAVGPSAQVDDIAAAADGTLYAVGSSLNATGGFDANHVRRSFDGGATWTTVASFSPVTGNGINKLAVDNAGRLYAAGLFNGLWTVLSSSDQGQNWSTADSFSTAGSSPEVRDITTDESGSVYVVGSATPARSPRQWLVRKGVPDAGSVTWTTVDAYTVDRTYGGLATCVAVKPSGAGSEILVAGAAQSSSGLNWLVRRSTDGGATWSVSDRFTSGIGGATLAIAPDGSIYTAGRIRTVGGTKKNPTAIISFVLRKGVPTAGAISWSTQQIIPENSFTTEFRPLSSVVDQYGRLFLAGYDVTRSDNTANYRVRVSLDAGQTSSETDALLGYAYCVTANLAGEIFTGGTFGDSLANSGGIIRKLGTPAE